MTGADDRPFAGLTVVVTRPRDDAAALVALLEARGARTVVMPLIEIVDVATSDEIERAVATLGADDWVVVTSPNAAARVASAVARSGAHVAAVGAATASALPRVDLVAERQSADGLVEVFPPAPPASGGAGRVLVAQAAGGADTLADGLAARGWEVARLHTHAAQAVVPSAAEQLAVMRADAVVFTSGSQAQAWVDVFGTTTPAIVVTIGGQTARNADACGLKVDVVAADHSLPGVVRALQEFLERAGRGFQH